MDDADLPLAIKGSLFGAVGTAGQRCTSLRRLYIQEGVYDQVVETMVKSYSSVKIGSPHDPDTLCGPLHNDLSMKIYKETIDAITSSGGKILVGGNVLDREGNYVEPTVAEVPSDSDICMDEHFCPVLFVFKIKDLEEGIRLNN